MNRPAPTFALVFAASCIVVAQLGSAAAQPRPWPGAPLGPPSHHTLLPPPILRIGIRQSPAEANVVVPTPTGVRPRMSAPPRARPVTSSAATGASGPSTTTAATATPARPPAPPSVPAVAR